MDFYVVHHLVYTRCHYPGDDPQCERQLVRATSKSLLTTLRGCGRGDATTTSYSHPPPISRRPGAPTRREFPEPNPPVVEEYGGTPTTWALGLKQLRI